jgi:hypothetical protein
MRAWYAKEAAKTAPVLGQVKGLYLKCVSAKRRTTTVLMQVFPSCIPRPQYVIISDGLKRSRIAARRSAYDKDDDTDMHHDFEPFLLKCHPGPVQGTCVVSREMQCVRLFRGIIFHSPIQVRLRHSL